MNQTDKHHEDNHDHDHGHGHDHGGSLDELVTLRDWLRYAVTRFNRAELHFGHGCTEAFDEAVWLLLHCLRLPHGRLETFLDACIPSEERLALFEAIEKRVMQRTPTAYITNEAWLGDYRFYIDERVIVPRSFFAELLEDSLSPWIEDPEAVNDALDLCTGSGCLAILMAHTFPNARVTAADLSPEALQVALRNVTDYALNERITLKQSDVFSALGDHEYDLIISNPPYVTAEAMSKLPDEYRHEPRMALAAGEDGLDIVRRLLTTAYKHLKPDGILAVEVGYNRVIVEAAFPKLPFVWLSTQGNEDMVFILRREDLPV